jgi:hypothetical protein
MKIAHFLGFFAFFCFFCLRRVAPVFALFWPVAGLGLSRAVSPLYMFALATLGRLSPCRGFPAVLPVGFVGSVGLFVCVIAWLSKRGRLSPCRGVCASSCRGVPVSLSGCQAFEQMFD